MNNRLLRKLSTLVHRRQFASDLDEEMAFHREQKQRELVAGGMNAKEARYAAMREFGNPTLLRERSQETIEFRFETAWQDLRYALRQLRKNAGFATIAIVILALGIGASTAIFSAVNPILFQPLPYPHSARIMTIFERMGGGSRLPSFGTFHGLQERNHSFEAVAVIKAWQPAMSGAGEPQQIDGQRVSAEYFRVLGVVPALGRDFQASDDVHRGPNVVILSDRLWRRRFHANPAIVGSKINLDDNSSQLTQGGNVYTVLGVMPAGFENVLSPAAQLWAPLQYNPALPPNSREWGHHLVMIGRLKPSVSRAQAASDIDVVLHTLATIYAKGFNEAGGAPQGANVISLHDDVIADVKPALLAVLGAVVLVLLIACVNVANLLLARGAQRRSEFAMRAALGASPRRIIRQLLTESVLLAIIGGTLGLVVAEAGVRALIALSPAGLPRVDAIRIDGAVFAFAFAVAALVGIAVGLTPALQAGHSDPNSSLQSSAASRTTAGGQTMRRSLVVSEVALALVLLVSAGLLLRSLNRLFAIDPGFEASHLLTMQVQESGSRYASDAARAQFFDRALEAVRHLPGVTSAALTSQLPLSGDSDTYGITFEAYPNDQGEPAFQYAVSPGYFSTMHIPIRRGRLLNENDRAGAPVAVLISESLSNRMFPNVDPIGQRVRIGPMALEPDKPWATIVGVVGNVKQLSLGLNEPDAFYTTDTQWAWVDNVQSLVVRTRGDAAALAPSVRSAIWSIDKDEPIVRVATMSNLVAATEAQRRFTLDLFAVFAIVGLVLAITGIYGVLSGSVTERTREIGVRAALGASRTDIVGLIVRQGMTLTGLGIAIGLLGAAEATQALLAMLFGISRLDPVTYVAVIALLASVSLIACSIPAWRAARVDPAITLRAE